MISFFIKNNLDINIIRDIDFLVGIKDQNGKLDSFSNRNKYQLKRLFERDPNIFNRLEFIDGFSER